MTQYERQLLKNTFGKKTLRKLEKSSESVPVNKKFKTFYNLMKEYYSTDPSTKIYYETGKVLPTVWEKNNLFKIFKTDYFIVQSDKFKITISPLNDGIYIHILEVNPMYRGCGIGNKILKMIRHFSNEFDIPVFLIPVPTDERNVGYEVLIRFYSNHGYGRENDSRYWKYEPNTISDSQNREYKMVS